MEVIDNQDFAGETFLIKRNLTDLVLTPIDFSDFTSIDVDIIDKHGFVIRIPSADIVEGDNPQQMKFEITAAQSLLFAKGAIDFFYIFQFPHSEITGDAVDKIKEKAALTLF